MIRDPEVRARAIADAIDATKAAGFEILATADAVIEGPKGNLEAFVHARRGSSDQRERGLNAREESSSTKSRGD